MKSLADCQHWAVSAFPTYMSISHRPPAIVSILELLESYEIDMLSRDHIDGSCWVHCLGVFLVSFSGNVKHFAQFSS